VRVWLAEGEGGWVARPARSQSSGVLTSMGGGAGLLVGPATRDMLDAGARYQVLILAPEALARETPVPEFA
jgi:molybdopterin biosynthesis enzyme